MSKTVRLDEVEVEVPEEILETLELCGYRPEEAIGKHLRKKIVKNAARLGRNECPKCGRPTERTLVYSQIKAVNAGEKTLEELGVCTCEED